MKLQLGIINAVTLLPDGGQLFLVELFADRGGLRFQVVILRGILIPVNRDLDTGLFILCPCLQQNAPGEPVDLKLVSGFADLGQEIRVIGEICGRQDDIGVLVDGHLAGNGAEVIFRVSGRAGADQNEEENKDQQKRFPHRITVFL